MNLRILCTAAVTAALAILPAAEAKQKLPEGVHVCNTASQNWQGGDLEVSPADPQGAHRFKNKLRKHNNTNANAAMHSRALALCGDGAPTDPEAGDGGGDTGGGSDPGETQPGYGV